MPVYYGNNEVTKCYFGSTQIIEGMFGNASVCNSGPVGAAPVITITGTKNINRSFASSAYSDAGATASDVEDNDVTITGNIVRSGHTDANVTAANACTNVGDVFSIVYDVTDSDGNVAPTKTRTITIINNKPKINVGGTNPFTLEKGDTYSDAGASASDTEDGTITSSIVRFGPTDAEISAGAVGASFTVKYNVNDSCGLAANEKTRTVNVVTPVIEDVECTDAFVFDGTGPYTTTPPGVHLTTFSIHDANECILFRGDGLNTAYIFISCDGGSSYHKHPISIRTAFGEDQKIGYHPDWSGTKPVQMFFAKIDASTEVTIKEMNIYGHNLTGNLSIDYIQYSSQTAWKNWVNHTDATGIAISAEIGDHIRTVSSNFSNTFNNNAEVTYITGFHDCISSNTVEAFGVYRGSPLLTSYPTMDLTNVTDMECFSEGSGMSSFSGNISNVVVADNAFSDMAKLTSTVASWPALVNAVRMYENCDSMVNHPGLSAANCDDCVEILESCAKLESIGPWDTSTLGNLAFADNPELTCIKSIKNPSFCGNSAFDNTPKLTSPDAGTQTGLIGETINDWIGSACP